MAQKKQDLFQWNRKTEPLNVGRHGKKKKKDSIKDWIKRVQDASEDAIQEILGEDILEHESLKEIIPDDEAVYEAQELLDGWLKETSFPDLQQEIDYKNETWSSTTGLSLDVKYSNCEYNTMFKALQTKYLGEDIDYGVNSLHAKVDPFLPLYNDDEDEAMDDALLVQDVLHGMLTKDFTKNIDLGMKPLVKTAKNPVPRMDIRHQEVKQKGERRRRTDIAKKNEKLTQEEIAQRAREHIVLEEKQRIQKESREEKAILCEMEKIKIELAEEKHRRDKEEQRKQKILEEAKLQIQTELRKQKDEDKRRRKEKEEARCQVQKEIEEEIVQQLRMRMKILHKYFAAWYNVVVNRRLTMGRVQSIADWKCKIRAWNAWRAYVACVRSNEEARRMEQAMKEKYRKEQMSIHHNNKVLLRRCLGSWLRYTHYRTEKKQLTMKHEENAKKMALFLEAASKGELWVKPSVQESEEENQERTNSIEPEDTSDANVFKEHVTCERKTKVLKSKPLPHKKPPEKSLRSQGKHLVEEGDRIDRCHSTKALKDDIAVQRAGIPGKKSRLQNNSKYTCTEDALVQEERSCREVNTSNTHGSSRDKLLTDGSDVSSCPSQVSSLVSRKPQIRSEKQITKPLYLAMEERQKERQKRKADIEEEKRKRDEERLEVLRAKEAERVMQEQQEKDEKLKQKQEQKRLETMKIKEKEFQVQQFRLKIKIAKDHYEKQLLRKYGLEPLTRLLQIARLNIQISDKYHQSLLLKLCFIEWHVYVKEISTKKVEKAEQCYRNIILKRTFRSWLKYRYHLQHMDKIARNYSSSRRLTRAFNAWQDYVTDERILMWAKESTAEEHDLTRLVTKCLRAWVRFVKLEKEGRQREHRKDEFRRKVQSWLPDYNGGTA